MESFRSHLRKASWEDVPHAPVAGFVPYQVVAPDGSWEGLFTGYFQPSLRGSRTKQAPYLYPVYAAPPDLVALPDAASHGQVGLTAWGRLVDGKLIPHVTRGEVMRGALDGQGLELCYVDDPIDLFFAHVQGSACVAMEDGTSLQLSYAGKSGHPYTAIGKVLRDRGALQLPVTMSHIKAWLREHPLERDEVLATNASFIFFKLIETQAPIGASGEPLVAEQSLAVDDAIWPYGLFMIVATRHPQDEKPFIRLMRSADTGSAIRGVIRGDIYFGAGEEAGALAGAMNAKGRLWVLLPD